MFKRCERGIRLSVDVQTSEGLCSKLDCTPILDICLANLSSAVRGYGMKQCASFTELTQQRRNQWTEPALFSLPHLQDIVLLNSQTKEIGKRRIISSSL